MTDELRTLVRDAVLQPTAEPPVDDLVRRAGRRRARRYALMGTAPALVLIAAVAVLPQVGTQRVELGPGGSGDEPVATELVAVHLDRTVVPSGTVIGVTLRSQAEVPLEYGQEYGLERWHSGSWEPVPAVPDGYDWDAIGLGLAPGEEGTDRIITEHLEPGRYRYTKTFRTGDGDLVPARAPFEVVNDESAGGDPEVLHGRAFVSVAVTRDGQPAGLVPGTEVRLEISADGAVSLHGGCNSITSMGGVLTEDRIRTEGTYVTQRGCTDELHAQDRWLEAFLRAGPAWRLDGTRLELRSEMTSMVLEEVAGGEQVPEAPPEPEPTPEPESQPDADPAALWDRTFVSVSVTEGGQPRPLLPGTDLEVTFERREPGGVVRWNAGCNTHGGEVQVSQERLTVHDIMGTQAGCDQERHTQDDWTVDFFDADPFWVLDGSRLELRAGETVIVLEER